MAYMALRSRRGPPPISAWKSRVGVFRAPYMENMLCAVSSLRAPCNHFFSAYCTLIDLTWAPALAAGLSEYADDCLLFVRHQQLSERPATKTEHRPLADAFPANFKWLVQLHGDRHVTNGLRAKWLANFRAWFISRGQPASSVLRCHYEDRHKIDRLLNLMSVLSASGSLHSALSVPADNFRPLKSIREFRAVSDSQCAVVCANGRGSCRRHTIWLVSKGGIFLADSATVAFTGTNKKRRAIRCRINLSKVDAARMTTLGIPAALLNSASLVVTTGRVTSNICAVLNDLRLVTMSGLDPVRWAPKNQVCHRVRDTEYGSHTDRIVRAVADLGFCLEAL